MSLVLGHTALPQTYIYSNQLTPSQVSEMLPSGQPPLLWTPSNNTVSNKNVSNKNVSNNTVSNKKVSNNTVSFNNWVKSQGINKEKMNEVIDNTDRKEISKFSSRSSKFTKKYPHMVNIAFSPYIISFSKLIQPIYIPPSDTPVTPLQQAIYWEDYKMIDFLLVNNVPSGKQPDGLTIIESVLRSSLEITSKHVLIKEFIHTYNIKLTKSEEKSYKKLINIVFEFQHAKEKAPWYWPPLEPRTAIEGGKHHKTHHRKRRTLRKKQTKTRRHHRK